MRRIRDRPASWNPDNERLASKSFSPQKSTKTSKYVLAIFELAENLGYALYRAVEQTKVALTDKELAHFLFTQSTLRLEDSLERWQFESWIQDDIQNIAASIRSLLDQCGVKPADIDSIFLTGGSSFVPVVRRFFSRTFGGGKLRSWEELTTVAKGLALRATEPSAAQTKPDFQPQVFVSNFC